jgi:hypothetical protein
MKYFLVGTLVLFIGLKQVLAQQGGAQTLRLAQSIYEQGRLHELPSLPGLKDSAIVNYSKSDQERAYRLLTLAHIYLEEPEKADESMLKLLNASHFYEPSDEVEPAEFMGLYKTFRTKPVFNVGLKFGVNGTLPLLNSIYYVSNNAPGKGKYAVGIGVNVGFVFEKEILGRSKNKFYGRGKLMFAPEIFYTTRTFKYTNPALFANDSTIANAHPSAASQTATISQTRIDINPIIQWKASTSNTFIPYLGFGPGISYLLSAKNTLVLTREGGAGVVSGPDVVYSASYHKIVPSLIGMAGLKYRFGEFYVLAEFRVQYALTDPVNTNSRTNTSGAFDYNFQLPNYKPLNLMANLGFVFPYFNPIKLKRR